MIAGQIAAGTVLVAIAISLLPVLLFLSLVMALLLIPARHQMIDVTPLHRRVERDFWAFRQRRR